MYDVNAQICAVDQAMDMMALYTRDLQDLRAHTKFDLSCLCDAMEQEVRLLQNRFEALQEREENQEQHSRAYYRCQQLLEDVTALYHRSQATAEDLTDRWVIRCLDCSQLADQGLKDMGCYMSKLNCIIGTGLVHSSSVPGSGTHTYVCIVDSSRYPQTAEHIRAAQNLGLPAYVTIDRPGAAQRRKASLASVRRSPFYDRDEYPCALFTEGGAGANVAYIAAADNRGAGSSMARQLSGLPDGTRVRIRVV